MPVIPTFETEGGQALGGGLPPRADPGAFAQAGQAAARAGEQVSQAAGQFANQYADARRQQLAAQSIASGMKQADDLQFELGKLPDRQAAMSQFNDRWGQAKAALLDNIQDPLVKSHVDSTLTTYGVTRQELTGRDAFGVEASANNAAHDQHLAQYAATLAKESNPLARAQIMDQIDGEWRASAKAGWQTYDGAYRGASAAYRSAVLMKAADDPIGADALAREFAVHDRMTAEDLGHVEEMLKNAVPRKNAENSMLSIYTRARAASGIAPAGGPIAASDLPDEAKRFLPVLAAGEESADGYASANPSSSARGRYQFLTSSWADQAPRAGVDPADFSPAAQDRVAWNYASNTYAAAHPGRTLQGDLAAGGHEKDIATALNKVWPSLPGGSQQNTDLPTFQARMQRAFTPISLNDQIAAFRRENPNMEPRFLLYGMSELKRLNNDDAIGQSVERADLERNLSNLESGYLQGITKPEIPETDIRRLFPSGKAESVIGGLNVARQAGDLFSGVQFATPDEEQSARQTLAIPGALSASNMKVTGHQLVPGAAPGGPALDETPDQMKLRGQVAARYDQLLAAKHKALAEDPAAYAAQNPTVAARFQAVDPQNPATLADAAHASLTLQRQLGVPDHMTRVLTNGQVSAAVRALTTTSPAQGDMGQALDQMAQQYGDLWPRAFGEMVQHGKLPPAFQVIGSMSEPGQTAARQDLIRAVQQDGERGGFKRLQEIVPPAERKTIDQGLDETIEPFRRTASVAGATGNLDLISNIRESVRSLAYLYATQGQTGDRALQAAADGILNQKYDFSGTLRAPKGHMSEAEALTSAAQQAVTPDQLAPIGGNPDLTPAQRTAIVATAARRNGVWVANERDDGAVLLAPLRDGSHVPVIRADGTRVEVKWPKPGQPWAGASATSDMRQGLTEPAPVLQ